MYIVIELQTNASGQVTNIVKAYDDIKEAKAEFYRVMAAIAVSVLPVHSALMVDNWGTVYLSGSNKEG